MSNSFLGTIQQSIVGAFSSIISSIIVFIPHLLSAVLVFIVGLIIGRWLKVFVTKILNVIKLTELVVGTGARQFFTNAQISQKIENVIGELVRYLVILIFFVASINLLGLSSVTLVFNNLLGFLPNIFAAVIIVFAGTLLAGFLEKLVKGSLGSIDLRLSRLMGKATSYLVFVFSVLAAVSQLGIAKNLIDALFVGFVATFTIAIGLSVGLGSKDLVKTVLEGWYKSLKNDLK